MADNNKKKRGGMPVSSQQAQIVDSVVQKPFTIVDAGAGSGKTHTLLATVLELLTKDQELTIDQFVLITFTNSAADELRGRIEEELSKRLAELSKKENLTEEDQRLLNLWTDSRELLSNAYIGTIHGFCRQLLKAFGYEYFVARESDVTMSNAMLNEAISEAIQNNVDASKDHPLRESKGESWYNYKLEKLTQEIYQHIRNRGLYIREVLQNTRNQDSQQGLNSRIKLAELLEATDDIYSRKKQKEKKIDSADMLFKVAEMLEDDKSIVKKIGQRYSCVFLDEFQDTDLIQMRIVKQLLEVLPRVLVVGDEKQSIYRFRGAIILLRELGKEFGITPLPLSVARRPTKSLLRLLNKLFESTEENYPQLNDPLKTRKDMVEGDSGLPAMIYINAEDNISDRVEKTAKTVKRLLKKSIDTEDGPRPVEMKDIALLFRANADLDKYEQELAVLCQDEEIVFQKITGGQFFRRPEILAAYRMLRLLVEYPNDVALAQSLNTSYLGIDARRKEANLLEHGKEQDDFSRWFRNEHREQDDTLQELRKEIRIRTVPEIVERLYRLFKIREFYLDRGNPRAVANLERLLEMVRNLSDSEQALTVSMIADWLQNRILSEYDEADALEQKGEEDVNYVRLMTVHAAKGTEFPIVVIPEVTKRVNGFARDVSYIVDDNDEDEKGKWGLDVKLPLFQETESSRFDELTRRDGYAEREESMRIFYVATTRAENSIVFIGKNDDQTYPPTDPNYSWNDEILKAWPELESLGAVRGDNKREERTAISG